MSIRAEREKSGRSIEEVCKHMGVSRMTLFNWERGSFLPRADKLPKLAEYLGCKVDDLLRPDG